MRREREAPVVCAVLCLVAAAAAVAACGKLCAASKTRRSATPSAGDAAGSTGSETQLTCLTAVEESLQSLLLLSPWRALPLTLFLSRSPLLFRSLSLFARSLCCGPPPAFVCCRRRSRCAAQPKRMQCKMPAKLKLSVYFRCWRQSRALSLSHTLSYCVSLSLHLIAYLLLFKNNYYLNTSQGNSCKRKAKAATLKSTSLPASPSQSLTC